MSGKLGSDSVVYVVILSRRFGPGTSELLRLAGGVLVSDDLVDALPEAAVRGEPAGRLPQLLQAAIVGAAARKRLGVFHCNQAERRRSERCSEEFHL